MFDGMIGTSAEPLPAPEFLKALVLTDAGGAMPHLSSAMRNSPGSLTLCRPNSRRRGADPCATGTPAARDPAHVLRRGACPLWTMQTAQGETPTRMGTRWCGRNGGGCAEMIMPDLSVVDAILFPILLGVGVLVFLTAAVMLREP